MDFYILDVFTTAPFSGNPLAVVLGADDLTDGQMQKIAREFNLSETIFVQQPNDPAHGAKVRIFHPAGELPFAGHPTIGCAILLSELANAADFETSITLEERAGLVPVKVSRKNAAISAEFVAPVIPFALASDKISNQMAAAALGILPQDIGFDAHQIINLQAGAEFLFVPLNNRAALAKAQVVNPAFQTLTNAARHNSVYVYCRNDIGFDARMFAPNNGMPEDPATGGASVILAAQLLVAGELVDGLNQFTLLQGQDMGRPSKIGLSVDVKAQKITAIRIKGSACRISHGSISTPPLEI